MLCPHCHVPLDTANHHSVEVAGCPECCGTWLTQAQLEKIIKSAQFVGAPVEPILIDDSEVDEVKVDEIRRAPKRKRPHFLSGAFDIGDEW